MEKDKLLKILIKGNVSSLKSEDQKEVYRFCLDYCASKDDNLGITIFSDYLSGMKAKDISKKTGLSPKELSDYKKAIYSNMVSFIFNELNKTVEDTSKKERVFITNRFFINNMITEKSFNLYCQKISIEKAAEILKNSNYESHINAEFLCILYEKLFGVEIALSNGYVNYEPGDTIIHVAYSGPYITDLDEGLPSNGKLIITYMELDPSEEGEEINDPYYRYIK